MGFFLYKKIVYECDDNFWNRVRAYKRDRNLKTLNQAMTELMAAGLQQYENSQKSVVTRMEFH
jgi:hypothetical protein